MRSFFLFLFLCAPSVLFGQFYSGAENSGRAGAFVVQNGVWSTSGNQAGLAFVNNVESGLYYTNKYRNLEVYGVSMAATIPAFSGTFGIEVQQLIFNTFVDRSYTLAYGMQLSDKIVAGVGFAYRYISLGSYYGSGGNVFVEGGVTWLASNKFELAMHLSNPFVSYIKFSSKEVIPVVCSVGCDYHPLVNWSVIFQLDKIISSGFSAHICFENNIYKELTLRAGYQTNPSLYVFGLGIDKKRWQGNSSFIIDPVLGWYPELSVVYKWS